MDPSEALPFGLSAATLLGGWVLGKRGRRASAVRDEADATESLSSSVAMLGVQVQDLYGRLAHAEGRAAQAEARLAEAELRAVKAEAEVVHLRAEVARLRSELDAATRAA